MQYPDHEFRVSTAIGLGAPRLDGGTFAAVEETELYAGIVDSVSHFAPQSVDLPNQLPLGQASDGRVAAHAADGVCIHGNQGGSASHSGRRKGRLDPGMPAAYHYYLERCIAHSAEKYKIETPVSIE
jgi:hypothetical protein